jgi:hypothetical protein
MDFQMDLNDQRAFELLKEGQMSVERCEREILFLKRQVQTQSSREMALLAEKDAMMLTINESHEIMVELGREVSQIREESTMQELRYRELIERYNEAVVLLQGSDKKQRLLEASRRRE